MFQWGSLLVLTSLTNHVFLTNKTPAGLNRGFGGPQLYFALERLIHKISKELNKPHLEIIKTNLIPNNAFPYKTPSGGLLDSGDYQKAIEKGVKEGGLEELLKNEDLKVSLSSNIKQIAVTDAADRIAKIALDLVK